MQAVREQRNLPIKPLNITPGNGKGGNERCRLFVYR